METNKWMYIGFGAAIIILNFMVWMGWLATSFLFINIVVAIALILSQFLVSKFLAKIGLEKTRKNAIEFYKEINYGNKKIGLNVNDIEGMEEEDRKGKKTVHSFLVDIPNSDNPMTAMEVRVAPSGNPTPRLVGYRKGIIYESLVPVRSKLITEGKEILPPRPKKEQQKLDIHLKQEAKSKEETVK